MGIYETWALLIPDFMRSWGFYSTFGAVLHLLHHQVLSRNPLVLYLWLPLRWEKILRHLFHERRQFRSERSSPKSMRADSQMFVYHFRCYATNNFASFGVLLSTSLAVAVCLLFPQQFSALLEDTQQWKPVRPVADDSARRSSFVSGRSCLLF